MPEQAALASELTFDEMLRARHVWLSHTDEYITTPFELRTILSELGQYPQDAELNFCVEAFGSKMAFNNFTTYLGFLKKRFQKPEPKDVDTLRAFVALGGGADRRGDINAENLRNACRHFDLTIDIDAMIREVDDDMSGKLEFTEFKSMWADDGSAVGTAALLAEGKKAESFDINAIDEHALGTSLRRIPSQRGGPMGLASPPPPEEDAPEEDQIELLKQHLFPLDTTNNSRKQDTSRKSNAAKRASMLTATRIPNAPGAGSVSGAGSANATNSAIAGGSAAPNLLNRDGGDGSDSDDNGDAPQAYTYKGHYKPPSPVILSLRHAKPPTKIRSGRTASKSPRSPRGTIRSFTAATPKVSPRR